MASEVHGEARATAGALVVEPDVEHLTADELAGMLGAAHEIHECERALRNGGLTLLDELLRGGARFRERATYPTHGVFDRVSCARYFYHVHSGLPGEHGHFHTYLRTDCIAPESAAGSGAAAGVSPDGDPPFAHLVAISMDPLGHPIGLVAPNRWATGETWRSGSALAPLVPYFRIDHAYPSWPVNRWLSAMFVLFRPHLVALLHARDAAVARWRALWPDTDVLERRDLPVAAWMPIDVLAAAAAAQSALAHRRQRGGAVQ